MRGITEENIKHPIAKALLAKGYKKFTILYDPYWSPDWGWTVVDGYAGEDFFGYNIKEALRRIKELPVYNEDSERKRDTRGKYDYM